MEKPSMKVCHFDDGPFSFHGVSGLSRIDLDLSRWFKFKSMRLKPCSSDVVCILEELT